MYTKYRDGISNCWNDIEYANWYNSRTFRLYFYLTYDIEFHFTINDSEYTDDSYSPSQSFWRDTDGAYVKQTRIEFTTKKSPDTAPQVYNIDSRYLPQDEHIDLTYNEYGPNMQSVTNIKSFFNHNKLKAGDKVTFTFDIIPDSDLPPIFVNLVDNSYAANYWLPLQKDSKGNSINLKLTDEPMKAGQTYKVSLTFDITENQKNNCVIAFTSEEYPNDGTTEKKNTVDIGFTIKANK